MQNSKISYIVILKTSPKSALPLLKFWLRTCFNPINNICKFIMGRTVEFREILEQFSTECRKTKTKVKTWSNYTKRGKTCASKSRLVLVLLVIGWESGVSLLSQSLSVVMQNHRKLMQITFDTQVKIALCRKQVCTTSYETRISWYLLE